MPTVSLSYRFRQSFHVPADVAFRWCTDYQPADGKLFSERHRRAVRWLNEDTAILTDTTYPAGRPQPIRRLIRIRRSERAWTNTHLDGPFRHSQFWYCVVADGARRSHLEFVGLHLESSARRLSKAEVARRAEELRKSDSDEWRRYLAPALEREVSGPSRGKGGRSTA